MAMVSLEISNSLDSVALSRLQTLGLGRLTIVA
jgi:hypothetical protein